ATIAAADISRGSCTSSAYVDRPHIDVQLPTQWKNSMSAMTSRNVIRVRYATATTIGSTTQPPMKTARDGSTPEDPMRTRTAALIAITPSANAVFDDHR